MSEPLTEDGWYRTTGHGWERVPDADAEAEVDAGGGWDLVRFRNTISGEEVPLF